MTPVESQNTVDLPEGLRGQFVSLRRRLLRVETLATGCLAAGAILASELAVFVSDRFWETPHWVRVTFLAAGAGGAAWFLLRWTRLWLLRPRDQRALAVLVQKAYRRLGDRLLGIVELADERRRPAHFSPALYRAAIRQVASEAEQFDFAAAVDARPARKSGVLLLVCAGAAAVPLLLSPAAAWNAWQRWITPMASIPRYTLVQVEGLPGEKIVAHGEPFELEGRLVYRSIWRPRGVSWQFERQPKLSTAADAGRVQVRLPGQTQPGLVRVRVGDARAFVRIAPTYRPTLRELSARTELPAYLQQAAVQSGVESGSLDILEGSRVQFIGKASRALNAAHLRSAGQNEQALRVDGESFQTEPLDLDEISELGFRWRDQFGLEGVPWRLLIRAQKDVAPLPELPDVIKDTPMLETEVLDIKATARDDFGVRELGLEWQLLTEISPTNSPAGEPFSLVAPTPHEKKLQETFHFSPTVLRIPADSVVEVRGYAQDYFPDRARSYTTVYRVHVMGNERHAELVRQNLESLLTRLEEVTRLEEKVAKATQELQDLPQDKLNSKEASDRAEAAKEDQTQNAANLERLAQEGKKTLREAFRNPTFSEQTLTEWAKNLQDMQQLSEQKMQQAAQSLKSAQQNPDERAQHLQQAGQKEQEILADLENMQRKVNKGLDELQALTLAQRLRKVASDEKEIADGLQKIVPETIGMFPRELPTRFKNTETALAGEQDDAQKDAQVLQGEIGRFFERTQKDAYGQVNKEMTEARTAEELERVRDLIQQNISMDAIQTLASWSERLNAWAELLEPKSDDSGGGGNSPGGGSPDEALLKQLLGLLRIRDREASLRQRTALVERNKTDPRTYQDSAKSLAQTQTQVREDFGKLQEDNSVPALEFPLQDVADSMESVEGLLKKPQTDRTTDVAQTKTIEMLSDIINLINEQQQKSQSSNSSASSTADDMEFLMQMMAQQPTPGQMMGLNPTGGGSQAGGTADRPITAVPGDPSGNAADGRAVNRASGISVPVPAEFRDALENYFRAVEDLDRRP